ncbi:MAG: bacteriohemerythrin [Magnetospirillum sp.]|nr:bacteriohemerythrin [Magnetospirillum sp.]
MGLLRKIEVTAGVYWVEAPSADLRILCGCPADAVKHLMKRGLITPIENRGVPFETGPNVILLSDVMVQNGAFANLAEFPVLQMFYRQGMIIPGHPGNTGVRPLLIGSPEQVRAQIQYIYRGNYGLVSEEELIEAGAEPDVAVDLMRLKLKFAFGRIEHPSELIDTASIEGEAITIKGQVQVRRLRLNVFEFSIGDDTVTVDLNLPPYEVYECPYPLGFYYIPREYFAVLHSGEGDGWDINRPCMSSIMMFQGRIYMIDAGPNVVHTLNALGIGINEIEGIFHTHSHDDHFAGLTTLIRSDHKLKYYATPLVRASVAKKLAALLSIQEAAFSDYFDVHPLVEGQWNDIDGLEVKPVFSPHPVETTTFLFRAMWEGGWRTYSHLADICRIAVLKDFVTEDESKPGISPALFQQVLADYKVPADVKKVDVGGGMIHGDAYDFREDKSEKIILAHTSQRHTIAQRAIGSSASFGTVDILIPSNHDFIWRSAFDLLMSSFPGVPQHQIRVLINNPMVTFNPGTILAKERQTITDIWMVLSGSVEAIPPEGGGRSVLSAGAMVGELSGLFNTLVTETYRALGFVKALKIPCSLYTEFVRRNHLFPDITRLLETREFLQRTALFGEVVAVKTLNMIVREMRPQHFDADHLVDVGLDSVGMVIRGAVGRFIGERQVDVVGPGDFFGEEMSVFWTPSIFRLRTLEDTEVMAVPAQMVADIPSVRWKLFESWNKRVSAFVDGNERERTLLRWDESYRVNILRVDTHHRQLVELANAVVDTVDSVRGVVETVAVLDALVEFASFHFGEEEAMLARYGYPELEGHRVEHDVKMRALKALRERIAGGGEFGSMELEALFHRWLIDHIADEDRRYALFLNAKGVY